MVIGVPVSTKFFAKTLGYDLDFWTTLALGISVFVIYTLDHIIDGYKWKENSYTLRHLLHYKYAFALAILLLGLTVVDLYIVFFKLSSSVIVFGVIMSLFVLIYLVLHYFKAAIFKRTLFGKELIISLVVSSCFIFLPAFTNHVKISTDIVLLMATVTSMNFGNLLLFSFYDLEIDQKAEFKTAHSENTKVQLHKISMISILISILCLVLIWNSVDVLSLTILLAMNLTLFIIWWKREFFSVKERYRFTGDLIYLYPVVYLLFI